MGENKKVTPPTPPPPPPQIPQKNVDGDRLNESKIPSFTNPPPPPPPKEGK